MLGNFFLGFREPGFQHCVLAALAKNANPEHSWPENFPCRAPVDIKLPLEAMGGRLRRGV